MLPEKAHFAPEYEPDLMRAVSDSMPKSAWRIDESTPKGSKNGFYTDAVDIREGRRGGIYLFRRWFDNPENFLLPNDPNALPADRKAVLELAEEEEALSKNFPSDVPVRDRVRWRRWKMAEAVANSRNDTVLGRASFLQEHAENDIDCWFDLTNPSFDFMVLRQMIDQARSPLPQQTVANGGLAAVPGMTLRVWELPVLGGRYVGGMDVAKGVTTGDASCLEVLNARTGMFVAELYGRANIDTATLGTCRVMEAYNKGLLAIESTGLGVGAVLAARRYGYADLYRRDWKEVAKAGREVKWGWETTRHNKMQTFLDFQEAVGKGLVQIPNLELVRELQSYNPDDDKDQQDDRVMAAMIAYQARLVRPGLAQPQGSSERREAKVLLPERKYSYVGR